MTIVSLLPRAAAALLVLLALLQVGQKTGSSPRPAPLPGAASFPPDLEAQLRRRLASPPSGHSVRTRHRNVDGSPRYSNRLLLERSPYLLQHAHNPVDWYPWGDEAFDRARRENKPVLLSIGYSTCHWCHVMEEESFDDEEIAAFLNRHYVAIKVDREERPEIDGIYLEAVRLLTGGAGWPLTVWLTPDRTPYYGGTYFPPGDGERGMKIGFLTLLRHVGRIYHEQPAQVAEAGADLAHTIARGFETAPGDAAPTSAPLSLGYGYFRKLFDASNGGFGGPPKFSQPVVLELLLRYHRRSGNPQALTMVERTLDAVASGGLYDHVGGGFHRYATDASWRLPHFEKMLYDNAQLVVAYLEAYQVTRRPEFARIARDTLAYVQREMTAPGGGFYTASDADSEGEEGRYFSWTEDEIRAALGEEESRLALAYFGVDGAAELHGRRHVLHVARPLAEVAHSLGLDEARAGQLLSAARVRLFEARRRRVPPFIDRKVVPGWNGLMISAFARAGQVLDDPAYTAAARSAASFILSSLTQGDRLRRSFIDGEASGHAFLDDYAFFIAGLLDLYETSQELRWLERAIALQAQLDRHFWDDRNGGFFFTAADHEPLLARGKPTYDGSEPSGNSVAILNLLRLYEWTGSEAYRERAERTLRAFARLLTLRPGQVPRMLVALDYYTDTVKQIVLVSPTSAQEARPFLERLRSTFLPNRVVTAVAEGREKTAAAALVPLVAEKTARHGKPTAYVCERRVCALPTNDPEVFAAQLATVRLLPSIDRIKDADEGHGAMRRLRGDRGGEGGEE